MDVHPQDDGTDDDNLASSILSKAPRLSTKSFASQKQGLWGNDENWTIRRVANGEEELYSRGKCVYWTRNSLIIKSFNFTEQVSKVLWAKFNQSDHVCICMITGISIFNRIGQHFQIPLPFTFKNVYATRCGLVIERATIPLDDSPLPILHAITHPTREMSPILFKPASRLLNQNSVLSYTMPSNLTIVGCHDTLPICLMYNSEDNQHSLWNIRQTTDEEIDEFQNNNEQSTFTHLNSSSFREGLSQTSLSISSKQRSSLLHQSNTSPATTISYSPKLDLRNKHSTLGNLAASRLGTGGSQVAPELTSSNVKSFFSSTQHSFNITSTPDRNRIINYLRDNIEDPILPDLTFEEFWTEPSSNSLRASKFFSTLDLVDNEFLVFVIPSSTQLKVFHCDKTSTTSGPMSLGRITNLVGIDALPIPTMKMMLVMDSNKSLALYSGPQKMACLNVPSSMTPNLRQTPLSPHPNRQMTDLTPIQMSSARKRASVGDRNSLGSDAIIQQMFQALSPVPHANKYESKSSTPLAVNDIKKIEYAIGSTIYVRCSLSKGRFEIPPLTQSNHVKKLLNAMKALVSREAGLCLISKWYQARRHPNQPDFMSAEEEMTLFKNWFMNSLDVVGNFFDHEKIGESIVRHHASPTKRSRKVREVEFDQVLTNIYALMFAIHLVFEDMLLMKLNYKIASCLAELLLVLACVLNLKEYQDYYWLKFPHLQEKFGPLSSSLSSLINRVDALYKPSFFRHSPPSVIDLISKIIVKSQMANYLSDETLLPYPIISNVTEQTSTVISLFSYLFNLNVDSTMRHITHKSIPMPKVNILDLNPHRSRAGDESLVKNMVELKKNRNYLSSLPEGICLHFWEAILNCQDSPPTDWDEKCFELLGRKDLVQLARNKSSSLSCKDSEGSEDQVIKLLFPDDIRVSEAMRMLASDTPVEFSITQRQGATEEESRDETHRHLYLLNVRSMAMPVGRGAICLRTYSPVIGENFEVPRLELSGRLISEDRPIEYTHDISVYPWPFFHNGVAAGLTICASTSNNIIDSTWINYNRPRSNIPHVVDMQGRDYTTANINNEHAGFLFALGLNGHLEKLSLMALHDYLCQNNDLTKLAILLGMSAAKRGSKDTNIIKVLSIHVDALLPPNSTELDVPAPVHAASILGVGLLYQGSADSHISKVLLEEIGRLPGPESNNHVDRESYSLSAGIAFGLVNLCKGGSTTISSSDQLRLYMLGGKRKQITAAQRERYLKQDCHRGEEEYINTHVTSPGGTLGLGLMYHRSNNQSVANWMRAPDTQTLLEYVRPDFLILRMLSYGLIMWDEVDATEEWINSHVPQIVLTHAFQRSATPATSGLAASMVTNMAIDYELISQAFCNIIAGCCMAIAMRFAGTADKNAYKTIYKHTKMLIALNNKPALAEQAGRPCIEACLNVLVTSLAVVMAGTGDLGVMRACRYLRSRLTQSCVFYGSYMALHMALGILFLGSCRFSLSSSPESIGALVCALYPIYPNHSSDNRYHLQALRHLYVLAAEPRLLIPRDIQTSKPVYAMITVVQRKSTPEGKVHLETSHMKAPCLMPEIESIHSVCVDDVRYWKIEINQRDALIRCLLKDQGYLSVKQRADSASNQLVQDINSYIIKNMPNDEDRARKSSALSACVKEDRVEQYSAMSALLSKHRLEDEHLRILIIEQLRIACSLAEGSPSNKMNILKSVMGDLADTLSSEKVFKSWQGYISGASSWASTDRQVAEYLVLNDLKCTQIDKELLDMIKSL